MKKISLVLAVLIVFSLIGPMSGFAAAPMPYEQQIADIDFTNLSDLIGGTTPEITRPGDEIIIPLKKDFFRNPSGAIINWDSGAIYGPNISDLSRNNIQVNFQVAKGHEYIRDVKLVKFTPTDRNPTYSAIRIRFAEDLVSTKEKLYEFSVMLQIKGISQTKTYFQLGGRFSNETFVARNNDYIYVADGTVVEAYAPFVDLRLDMGNGIEALVDTATRERYYGVADYYDNKSDKISEAYPEIEVVYDIQSVNIKATNTRVKFKGHTKNDAFYVYNVDGAFVGMSDGLIPYSNRFYLSSKSIEIDPALVDVKLTQRQAQFVDNYQTKNHKEFSEGVKKSAGNRNGTSALPVDAPKEY